jgi:hypothetical protein
LNGELINQVKEAQGFSPWAGELTVPLYPTWPYQHAFKSTYMNKHLSRLKVDLEKTLTRTPLMTIDPTVLQSVRILQKHLQARLDQFEKNGITYDEFLKLSYLVAQQLSFFVEDHHFGDFYFGVYTQRFWTGNTKRHIQKLETDSQGKPISSPLIESDSELENYFAHTNLPYVEGAIQHSNMSAESIKFDYKAFVRLLGLACREIAQWRQRCSPV